MRPFYILDYSNLGIDYLDGKRAEQEKLLFPLDFLSLMKTLNLLFPVLPNQIISVSKEKKKRNDKFSYFDVHIFCYNDSIKIICILIHWFLECFQGP